MLHKVLMLKPPFLNINKALPLPHRHSEIRVLEDVCAFYRCRSKSTKSVATIRSQERGNGLDRGTDKDVPALRQDITCSLSIDQ